MTAQSQILKGGNIMNKHQLADNLAASAALVLTGKKKYFSVNTDCPPLKDCIAGTEVRASHLRHIPPDEWGRREIAARTPFGPTDGAFSVEKWIGPEKPTIIYHHGNNERPFDYRKSAKNTFNSIFAPASSACRDGDQLQANLINLRAPFHNGTLAEYSSAMQDVKNFVSMISTSVVLIQELLEALRHYHMGPVLVAGISLGGWITNVHRAYFNTAHSYIPIFAGAALAETFLTSAYRKLTGEPALADPERLRRTLNFEDDFQKVTDTNVFPLLATFDQYIDFERQKQSYSTVEPAVLGNGHITGTLNTGALKNHIAEQLQNCLQKGSDHLSLNPV
jgi:hypothetical protein